MKKQVSLLDVDLLLRLSVLMGRLTSAVKRHDWLGIYKYSAMIRNTVDEFIDRYGDVLPEQKKSKQKKR